MGFGGGGGGGWGGSGAGGWSGGLMAGPNSMRRGMDGWDDEELGKLYDQKVRRRLLPYLKPYPLQAIGAVIGVIGFAVMSFSQPLLVGLAIEDAITGDLAALNRDGIALVVLALGSWFFQWLQLNCSGYIGHRVLLQLRQE